MLQKSRFFERTSTELSFRLLMCGRSGEGRVWGVEDLQGPFPTLTLGIQYCSVEIVHMMLRAWAVPKKIMKTKNCFLSVHTCVGVFLLYVSKLEGYFGKTANIRKSKLLIICKIRWLSECGKQILWIIRVTLTEVTHKYN